MFIVRYPPRTKLMLFEMTMNWALIPGMSLFWVSGMYLLTIVHVSPALIHPSQSSVVSKLILSAAKASSDCCLKARAKAMDGVVKEVSEIYSENTPPFGPVYACWDWLSFAWAMMGTR